jgi:hypothetical protein
MKTKTFISILILVLAVLIIAGSCATRKIAISDEELSNAYIGTWINQDIWNTRGFPKIEFFPDRTWYEYASIDSESASHEGELTIIGQWKDSNGNIFFESKFKCMVCGNSGYMLQKISDSENTLEIIYSEGERKIEEWNTGRYYYRIYYRQE